MNTDYPRFYTLGEFEYVVLSPGDSPRFHHDASDQLLTAMITEDDLRERGVRNYDRPPSFKGYTFASTLQSAYPAFNPPAAFDPIKPVQTRSGKPARIVCRDQKGGYPIVALVASTVSGQEYPVSYAEGGAYSTGTTSEDLVNIPPPKIKISGWLNIYGTNEVYLHLSRSSADKGAPTRRIACVPINLEVSEGEGL